MTNQDEFDDPKNNDFLGSVGPKAAFFIVLIALSFMIGVVWKLYAGGGNVTGDNVPVIRAETQDYKIAPDDAGGMELAHKDSTIFSSLNSDPDEQAGVENLLADDTDEEPMPRSQLFAGLNTEPSPDLHADVQDTPMDEPLSEDDERILDQAKEAQAVVTNLVEDGADAIVDVEEDTITEKPAAKVESFAEEEKIESELVPAKKVETLKVEPKVESKPAETPAMGGDYYVQLASVQDKTAATVEWNKLQSKYSALSGYSYRIETADLGAKGTYYRIQAGPVSKSQADSTCATIKRSDANGCLVKKK